MADRDHLADHRLELIMSELSARGECRTRQLAQQFQLSEMTV
ncbi:MAG: DeoR family transcriptional regulator, partial [Candidatus Accumulibacter sp.]|nr:DeoR family transcriptional regulator [Accumulibacter sp.]